MRTPRERQSRTPAPCPIYKGQLKWSTPQRSWMRGEDAKVWKSLSSICDYVGLYRMLRGMDDVWRDGHPDSGRAQFGLNHGRASYGHARLNGSGVPSTARHLDRPVWRTGHHAALAGGLRRPLVDLVVCDRALAISSARPRARASWRFLL